MCRCVIVDGWGLHERSGCICPLDSLPCEALHTNSDDYLMGLSVDTQYNWFICEESDQPACPPRLDRVFFVQEFFSLYSNNAVSSLMQCWILQQLMLIITLFQSWVAMVWGASFHNSAFPWKFSLFFKETTYFWKGGNCENWKKKLLEVIIIVIKVINCCKVRNCCIQKLNYTLTGAY